MLYLLPNLDLIVSSVSKCKTRWPLGCPMDLPFQAFTRATELYRQSADQHLSISRTGSSETSYTCFGDL